eukprot:gene16259-16438_t
MDIAYQPKPASFDTVKIANYVSGGFNAYSNTHLNDFLVSGQFNLSQGYVFKNFNLAYGAFGGRFSANAFVSSGRTDFRFIGIEMAYSHEFGSYADYRQYLNTQPGTFVDPRTNLFTIGLTTEVYFHNRNDSGFQHGIRGFLGTTLGYNELSTTYYTNETSTDRIFFRNG